MHEDLKKKTVSYKINPVLISSFNQYIDDEKRKGNSVTKVSVIEMLLRNFLEEKGVLSDK